MALLTLAEAKLQLNIPADNTADDAELQGYVDAIAGVVERHTGRVVEQRQIVETLRPRRGVLMLSSVPVISLDAVASLDGADTWDPAAFDVDPDTGEVLALSGSCPRGRVRVTYTAGYAEADVPGRYKQGALVILQHVWETQRGQGSVGAGVIGPEESWDPASSFSIPRRALEWLGEPLPGIA